MTFLDLTNAVGNSMGFFIYGAVAFFAALFTWLFVVETKGDFCSLIL